MQICLWRFPHPIFHRRIFHKTFSVNLTVSDLDAFEGAVGRSFIQMFLRLAIDRVAEWIFKDFLGFFKIFLNFF